MAKTDRGFASMDPTKRRELASRGGKAAHLKGTAHEWSTHEARAAGRRAARPATDGIKTLCRSQCRSIIPSINRRTSTCRHVRIGRLNSDRSARRRRSTTRSRGVQLSK